MKNLIKGFTIIELLVVIIIISAITAIVLSNVVIYHNKSRVTAAATEIGELKKAVLIYYADTGQYPAVCDEGCTSASDPFKNALGVAGWKGPYIQDYSLAHGWKGHIGWLGAIDFDLDGKLDLGFQLDDDRPQMGSGDNQGQIPTSQLQKIDALIDDGNLATGLARGDGGGFPGGGANGTSATGEMIIIFHP